MEEVLPVLLGNSWETTLIHLPATVVNVRPNYLQSEAAISLTTKNVQHNSEMVPNKICITATRRNAPCPSKVQISESNVVPSLRFLSLE